jgi:hypothetical protein
VEIYWSTNVSKTVFGGEIRPLDTGWVSGADAMKTEAEIKEKLQELEKVLPNLTFTLDRHAIYNEIHVLKWVLKDE